MFSSNDLIIFARLTQLTSAAAGEEERARLLRYRKKPDLQSVRSRSALNSRGRLILSDPPPRTMSGLDELRPALDEVLAKLLAPDPGQRSLAEQQLKALQVTEEYGVALTEVTLSAQQPLPVRQMTALLLRQYVNSHWCSAADKFVPPEVTQEAKVAIRRMLPEGLKESISKVRWS